MNFEPTIGIGAIVEIIISIGGLIGGWFTLRNVVKTTVEKLKELQVKFDDEVDRNTRQHEENRERSSKLEIYVAKEYLSKDDFRDYDQENRRRFERLEHAVNNSATKTVQMLREAIRETFSRKREIEE